MLEFIVLGLVPGTNIQINFADVLRLAAGLLLLVVLTRETRRYYTDAKTTGKIFPFLHKQA